VTLEDVANQLLLPILGDVDPATLELSIEEETVEAKLKKGMSGNAKLSYWVSSSSKFSVSACRAAFVVFWLCKFIFGLFLGSPPLRRKAFIFPFSYQDFC